MNMKRISFIVTALALLVALPQCKKEQNAQTNETVAITLDIRYGGARMDVNTVTGEVTYEEGDVIYVVSSGKYVGTLTHNGTNFGGTITNPTVGEPLHFYFLGNVAPAETLAAGTTTTCSVVITDQTEHLPVIEYAPSDETYTAGATAFTAFLLNKCALVKFNVTTSSEDATCVTGFNNKVTVNFTDALFTYSKVNGGNITLPAGSGEKWAILLPQEAMEASEAGSAYSQDGTYTGTCGAVPAIYDNGFLTTGVEVNVTSEVNPSEVPVGAISGKFTINANGDQVYFSQGNLQYQASTNTWRFAENQYDYLGEANSNISQTYDGWIDLFGWGTSGWDNGNVYYQPYDYEYLTDWNAYDYGYGYGPTDGTSYNYNLTGTYANADWGVYNAVSNGGNVPNQWRTLNSSNSYPYSEWYYILYNRSTLSGIRYAKGIVNGVNGVILLPDNWNTSVYELNYTNRGDAPYTINNITIEDWALLESSGAVFLPAAGYRYGTSVSYLGSEGSYWWSGYYDNRRAYRLSFNSTNLSSFSNSNSAYTNNRYYGLSVRLVRDAE
jgi:hypothetical protein